MLPVSCRDHQGGQFVLRGVRGRRPHRPPAPDDRDAVGDRLDLAQLVGDEDDRLAGLGQPPHDGEQFVGLYLANPIAEAVLLMQRCFWTTVTSDPAATAATNIPDHLFTRGFIQLGACLVFLVFAQVIFMRLDNKFPERL